MLTDEVLEKVIQRLIERINQGNEFIIKEIGKSIGELRTVTPSKAHQLASILKYGGSYEKIVKQLAKITKLNVQDIYKIFEEVAKNDWQFAQQFYKYRNVDYIPYKENTALKNMVNSIAKITANEYMNLSKTNVMGYALKDSEGNLTFRNLKQTYNELIDEAILNVGTGKETFDSAMYRKLKEVGESGLKVVYPTTYIGKDGKEHHYIKRLDSAIRMNMKDGLRQLHNETQQQFGKEFKSDGVEISVHLNPAPDHENVQGHQFSNEEFEKFQTDQDCHSYDGEFYPAIADETGRDRRAIGEYNCYHYIFSIVLGVSKPEYNKKQLKKIIDSNHKGFEFEGKKYTNYEGTQLQRQLELELRKAKDNQIIGKASKNEELIAESQQRITQLTSKYKKLNKISKLPDSINRARVSGYRRTKINNISNKQQNLILNSKKDKNDINLYEQKTYNNFKDNNLINFVDVDVLDKFKTHDKTGKYSNRTEEELINLENQIKKEGIKKGGNLLYDNTDGYAIINEGNNRLAIAKDLGFKKFPIYITKTNKNNVYRYNDRGVYLKKGLGVGKDKYLKLKDLNLNS